MGEPIIGAQPLAGLKLVVGDQRPAVSILAAFEPPEGTFGFVDHDRTPRAVHLPLADGPQLMPRSEGIVRVARLRRRLERVARLRRRLERVAAPIGRRLDPRHV